MWNSQAITNISLTQSSFGSVMKFLYTTGLYLLLELQMSVYRIERKLALFELE